MKYICSICGYIYDEDKEAVPFSQLPDSWTCPLCKAPKSAFNPEAKPQPRKPRPSGEAVTLDSDLQELSAGALSALFSNLARGCEKQYKKEESELFLEIARYFDGITPGPAEVDVQTLADRILDNLNNEYPDLEAVAAEHHDRGTLRAYTWGNKVTKMQQAVIGQYLQMGEAFLEHTNVWVCTVCGFIYIGDNPPSLCPVCKVPDWKFEKMEGGSLA